MRIINEESGDDGNSDADFDDDENDNLETCQKSSNE